MSSGNESGTPTPLVGVPSLSLPVPESWLDALGELVAERVTAASVSPWMTRRDAAAYVGVPVSRFEKDKTIPVHAWDGRRLYYRAELDSWLLAKAAS